MKSIVLVWASVLAISSASPLRIRSKTTTTTIEKPIPNPRQLLVFNAGYGPCSSYAPGEPNYDWCAVDQDSNGVKAEDACAECGKSSETTGNGSGTPGSFEAVDELVNSLETIESKSNTCSNQVSEVQNNVDSVTATLNKIDEIRTYTRPIRNAYNVFKPSVAKLQDVVKFVPKVGKVIKVGLEVVVKVGRAVEKIDTKIEDVQKVTKPANDALERVSMGLEAVSDSMSDISDVASASGDLVSLAKSCSLQTTSSDQDDIALDVFAAAQLSYIPYVETASEECVDVLEQILNIPDEILDELLETARAIAEHFQPILQTLTDVANAVGSVFNGVMNALCCLSPELSDVIQAVSEVISLTTCFADAIIGEITEELAKLLDIGEIYIPAVSVSITLPKIQLDQFMYSPENCAISVPSFPTVEYEPYAFTLFPELSLSIDDVLPSETCNIDFEDFGQCQAGLGCCDDDDCSSMADKPICDNNVLSDPTFTCVPRKQNGELCTYDNTCASGNCHVSTVCTECSADSDCSGKPGRPICDNNILSDPTFTCVPRKQNGELCTYDSTCASGNCHLSTQCSECSSDSDCSGKPGRPICDNNVLSNPTLTCIPKKPIGDNCSYDDTCQSGNCYKPTGTGAFGTCQCNECGTSGCGGCGWGQQCNNPGPFESNYCYTPLQDGATCSSDDVCASGYCRGNFWFISSGTCFTLLGEGDACPSESNSDCAGSAGCYRTTRYGNYKCCSNQNFCDVWDPGCTTGFWYCSSSGLGR